MFSAAGLQRCSREIAASHGIERTPQQWNQILHSLIADYRLHHPCQGLSNLEVWHLIKAWANQAQHHPL